MNIKKNLCLSLFGLGLAFSGFSNSFADNSRCNAMKIEEIGYVGTIMDNDNDIYFEVNDLGKLTYVDFNRSLEFNYEENIIRVERDEIGGFFTYIDSSRTDRIDDVKDMGIDTLDSLDKILINMDSLYKSGKQNTSQYRTLEKRYDYFKHRFKFLKNNLGIEQTLLKTDIFKVGGEKRYQEIISDYNNFEDIFYEEFDNCEID